MNQTSVGADLPPLIPRDVLFGNPDKAGPQISPDGEYLAYLAPDSRGVLQVWVRSAAAEDDRILTADKRRGIRSFFWTYDGRSLVYPQDSDGDENYHLHAVDVARSVVRDLTPFRGARAWMIACEPGQPDEILVEMNVRDRRLHDVYRVHLRTASLRIDTENPGNVADWRADARLQVRASLAVTDDGGQTLSVRDAPDQAWRTLRRWGPDDQGHAVAFSADGRTLYLVGSHDANSVRLLAADLATGAETVLAEDSHYDVAGVLRHPTRRHVQAVSFYRDRLRWQVLDEEVAEDFRFLEQVRRGDFQVSSRDLADEHWLVSYVTDDGPVYYYLYDRPRREARLLFSSRRALEGLPLARMEPISFEARDALTIHGYLTTPVGLAPRDLPAVLYVHGGPWARDVWGYNPTVQWLANRGYAVLQVNFRGSDGYGKAFLNAGNRQWAGTMHDDLVDGARWLVRRGVADPKRTAIMGGSYGGYAVLVGLAFTPEVFAAGVDLVGPSSLETLLNNIPPYWEPIRPLLAHRIGDVRREGEFLRSRSPLFAADRIVRPLLIGQGANDPRVRQVESDQIVRTLRGAGRTVEYIVYGDEGHGMARPANRLHFYAHAEQFLARHLGGRAEPVADIPGHSGAFQ